MFLSLKVTKKREKTVSSFFAFDRFLELNNLKFSAKF